LHLTEITCRNLKPPANGQAAYHDDAIPGFSLRVSQGGTKTFTLVYGSPRKRISIGRYPIVSLAEAREKARRLLAHRMLHGDAPPDLTFAEVLTLFLTIHIAPNNRPSSAVTTERLLKRHFLPKLAQKPLKAISTADLISITDRLLSTPSEANHAFTAIRTLLRWATHRRYIAHSPLEGLKLPAREVPRERVLTPAELRVALAVAPSRGVYGQIIQFLCLTGQRRGQIINLMPAFIGEDTIQWPARCMKANRDHVIPIGPMTKELLNTFPLPCTFNNWSNAHVDFLKVSGIAHFTRHDLRRSYSTIMAQWTPPHVLERFLAHTKGQISGVAAIYNRHSYMDEMREAVLTYERWLTTL
jgi:integrase